MVKKLTVIAFHKKKKKGAVPRAKSCMALAKSLLRACVSQQRDFFQTI
jgi:hypothetical protein